MYRAVNTIPAIKPTSAGMITSSVCMLSFIMAVIVAHGAERWEF